MAERTQAPRALVAGADDALNRRIHWMNVLTALRLRLMDESAADGGGLPLPFAADSPHNGPDLQTRSDGKISSGNENENGREERHEKDEPAARRRAGSERA